MFWVIFDRALRIRESFIAGRRCAWGPRPVNLHIEGIRKLGANIEIREGYIIAKAKKLHGAKYPL